MAEIPTTEKIQEWIFEEIRSSGSNPRPDEIAFQLTKMQLSLHARGVRADEYGNALTAMVEAGLLRTAENGPFMMLTAAGFDHL